MEEAKRTLNTLYIDRGVEKRQSEKLAALRKKRSKKAYEDAIRHVKEAAENGQNLMEPIIGAVKAYATLQEICDTLRGVFGEYREAGSF